MDIQTLTNKSTVLNQQPILPDDRANMLLLLVTFDRSQQQVWLNADAPENIELMSVTDEVSKFDKFWLNDDALANIARMVFTFETSKFDTSWLNADALENI